MLPHTVEDRLEPALAGRARSFIADFHALQEPSVDVTAKIERPFILIGRS